MSPQARLWRGALGAVALLALSLLGACSPIDRSLRPESVAGPDASRLARLEAIADWRVEGRAVIHSHDRAWQLGFDWCRQAASDSIVFMDPFGRVVARLIGERGHVVLERPGRPRLEARDGEALLAGAFGWSLPLSSLPDWFMGRAVSGEVDWDPTGRPIRWSTAGWQIDYLDYRRWGDIDLPRRLEARRVDRSIRLRLVVEDWDLSPSCHS